jgi:hypothetical protein
MSDITVTNPGSVNAADQAFGTGVPVERPRFGSVPASTGPNNADGDDPSPLTPISSSLATSGTPTDVNQTVDIAPAQTAGVNINGGTYSPQSANVVNTSENNVAGQIFGKGVPANVFV